MAINQSANLYQSWLCFLSFNHHVDMDSPHWWVLWETVQCWFQHADVDIALELQTRVWVIQHLILFLDYNLAWFRCSLRYSWATQPCLTYQQQQQQLVSAPAWLQRQLLWLLSHLGLVGLQSAPLQERIIPEIPRWIRSCTQVITESFHYVEIRKRHQQWSVAWVWQNEQGFGWFWSVQCTQPGLGKQGQIY